MLQTHKEVRLKRPPRAPRGAIPAGPSGPRVTLINLLWSLLSFPRTTDLTCHVLSLHSDLRLTGVSIPQPSLFTNRDLCSEIKFSRGTVISGRKSLLPALPHSEGKKLKNFLKIKNVNIFVKILYHLLRNKAS